MADKFMELRIQVLELTGKAKELKNNSQDLSKVRPTDYDLKVNERLNDFIAINDALHKKMYEVNSHLTEKDINDMTISILTLKSAIDLIDNEIKKITQA